MSLNEKKNSLQCNAIRIKYQDISDRMEGRIKREPNIQRVRIKQEILSSSTVHDPYMY